jgi:uncharacterized protein (DUF2141 family)
LKPGRYFIYGFNDKNKNLLTDSKTEPYAFLRDSIQLIKNALNIRLPFIYLDSRPLKLTSARPTNTYFNIKTAKNLTTFTLTTSEGEPPISSFGEDQTNIRIYNTLSNQDSVLTYLTARDSINNLIDTTLYVKFSDREAKPEPFDIQLNKFNVVGTKGIIQGQIKFTKPVRSINFDSLFYNIDSTQRISFDPRDLSWDSLHNILSLEKKFDKALLPKEPTANENMTSSRPIQKSTPAKPGTKPSMDFHLYLGKGAFISVESDSSKKITERLAPLKFEDTGVLLIEIQTQAKHFLVQLLTKDFEVLSSKRDVKKFSFDDLKPGDYQLRLVIDENNDGKWNPGNFFLLEEPEPIIFYKNEKGVPLVNLKANWELGPLLIKH